MMTPARKEPDKKTYSGRFAIRLRTLREKAGLTVEDVATAMGVSATAVYHWESSARVPPLESFPAFAEIFKLKKTKDLMPNE